METAPIEVTVQKSKFVEQNIDPNQQSSRTGPTPRELIAMKKESKKIEEESQLTFQPKFSAKPKDDNKNSSSSAIGSGSRFDKLYSEAMKRQQDNVEKPKPLPNAEDLTFKPKISARATSRSKRAPSPLNVTDRLYTQSGAGRTSSKQLEIPPPTFQPQISKRAISVERNQSRDISDRLYQLGKEHQDKLDKLKQEYTNNKLHQECTFAPKINLNGTGSRSRSSSTSRPMTAASESSKSNSTNMTSTSTTNHNDVTNRLLNYEEHRLTKLEEAKKQQLELESQNATFKPAVVLTKRASTPNRQPGETVFDKLSKQMLQKDMLSPSSAMNDSNNNNSMNKTASGSDIKLSDGKVFERLTAVNTDQQHMQAMLDKVKQDLELSGCTFKPQVNTTVSGSGSHTKPVHQRLEEETEKWKEDIKKRENLKKQEELKGATFTPVIPAKSAAMTSTHSNHHHNGTTIFDRLNSEGDKIKADQEYRMEQRRLEEMKDATFAPTLPQKSLDLTSNRSPSRRASTPTSSGPNSPTHRTAAATAAESFASPLSHTELQQQHQLDQHAESQSAVSVAPTLKSSSNTSSHLTPKAGTAITSATRRSTSSTNGALKENSSSSASVNSSRNNLKGNLRNNMNNTTTPATTPIATATTTTTATAASMNGNRSSSSISHTPGSINKRPNTTTTTATTSTTTAAAVTPLSVKTSGAGVNLKQHVMDCTSPRTNEASTPTTAATTAPAAPAVTTTTTTSKSSKNGMIATGSAKGKTNNNNGTSSSINTTSNTASNKAMNSTATTAATTAPNINAISIAPTPATTESIYDNIGQNNNSNNTSTSIINKKNDHASSNNNTNNSPTRSLKTIASATVDDQPPFGVPTLRGQRKSNGNMQPAGVMTEDEINAANTTTTPAATGSTTATTAAGTPLVDAIVYDKEIHDEAVASFNGGNNNHNNGNGNSSDCEIALMTTMAAVSTSDLLAGIEAYDDDDDDDDEGTMSIVTEALPTARLDPDDAEFLTQQPFTIIENDDDEEEDKRLTSSAINADDNNNTNDDDDEEFY